MKIKLAKYVAKLLVANGITQCFSVTGGGAMHLNDGFGHDPGMHVLYMHHEQACAIAAESYARIYNRPACLCVTTGPGGTNAITGVVGAWSDTITLPDGLAWASGPWEIRNLTSPGASTV